MIHTDPKLELTAARKCQADLKNQLVEIETKLRSLNRYDATQVSLRAHYKDLESEIAKLDSTIAKLEQVVAEAEAKRRADIEARLPDVKAAMLTLAEALDACAEAERAVKEHRTSLRDERLPSFKELPALVQPHAKKLVEQAMRELAAAAR